jgi:hypothetical protein
MVPFSISLSFFLFSLSLSVDVIHLGCEISLMNLLTEELYVEFIRVGLLTHLWNITLKQKQQSSERKVSIQILELLSQNGAHFSNQKFYVLIH